VTAERAPFLEALRDYAARNPARLNVLGHEGGPGADPELGETRVARAATRDAGENVIVAVFGMGEPARMQGERLVAAESLAAYPPGDPNVLPGERLTAETLECVQEALDHGGSLRGASDRRLRTVRVVAG
jgi:arginine decarboxylase